MDRKQKIMKLIIDALDESGYIKYEYTGADTTLDTNLVSLNFVARTDTVRGELNVRGLIDMPLQLKPQYDNRTALNDHADIRKQIDADLENVSGKINKLL